MALNTQIADATVNAQADALGTLCDAGYINIYDGTQPATADTATAVGNTLGVTLTFGQTAFAAANSGLLTAEAITSGTAVAAITPTWARIFTVDDVVVMDVSAGATGCNLTIGPFTAGTVVSATSFTHDVRNSTSGY